MCMIRNFQDEVVRTNWDNQFGFEPIFVSSLQMILQYASQEYQCTCITMEVTSYPSISQIHISFINIYWQWLFARLWSLKINGLKYIIGSNNSY